MATAVEFDSKRHPHRTLVAVLDVYTQECRPSVGELIALISWMLGGMRHQDLEKESRPKDKSLRFHIIFPVCSLAHGDFWYCHSTNKLDPRLFFHATSSRSCVLWPFRRK